MAEKTLIVSRTIHPVGQGGFASETFKLEDDIKFTMVYDCGYSKKGIFGKAMENRTGNSIDLSGEAIDLLCISHFDKDHFAGVPTLLEHYECKHIMVPFLELEDILLIFCGLAKNYTNNKKNPNIPELELLTEIYYPDENNNEKKKFGKIFFVSPAESKYGKIKDSSENIELSLTPDGNYLIDSNKDTKRIFLKYGQGVEKNFGETLKWLFKPFHLEHKNERLKSIFKTKIIEGIFDNNDNLSNREIVIRLKTYLKKKDTLDIIKEIYIKTLDQYVAEERNPSINISELKNLNTFSLCLFSGVLAKGTSLPKPKTTFKGSICQRGQQLFCDIFFSDCCAALKPKYCVSVTRCLYLGDYNARKYVDELTSFYNNFKPLSMLQVPHHGSKKSWNIKLLKLFKPCNTFIQYGRNGHGHPSESVLEDCVAKTTCYLVSDDITSKMNFLFELDIENR